MYTFTTNTTNDSSRQTVPTYELKDSDIYQAGKREKDSFSRQTVPTYELKDSDIYEAGKKEEKKDSLTRDKRNFPDLVGY